MVVPRLPRLPTSLCQSRDDRISGRAVLRPPTARRAPAEADGPEGAALEDSCLLVGLDSGFLQLHAAASGALMHRQQLHEGPVVAIQTRRARI